MVIKSGPKCEARNGTYKCCREAWHDGPHAVVNLETMRIGYFTDLHGEIGYLRLRSVTTD